LAMSSITGPYRGQQLRGFQRWKRSNFFAGFGLPELGDVVPFLPLLPEMLLVTRCR
jgi:hypothetical protein